MQEKSKNLLHQIGVAVGSGVLSALGCIYLANRYDIQSPRELVERMWPGTEEDRRYREAWEKLFGENGFVVGGDSRLTLEELCHFFQTEGSDPEIKIYPWSFKDALSLEQWESAAERYEAEQQRENP